MQILLLKIKKVKEPGAGGGCSVCGLVAHGARGQGRGGGRARDVENLGLPTTACPPSNQIFANEINSRVIVSLLCLDSVVAAKDSGTEEADDDELGDDHGGARVTVRAVEPVTAYM